MIKTGSNLSHNLTRIDICDIWLYVSFTVGLCSELLRTAGAFEHIYWPCSTGPDCPGVAPRLGSKRSSLYLLKTHSSMHVMYMQLRHLRIGKSSNENYRRALKTSP